MKTVYVCPECGSDGIEAEGWVPWNGGGGDMAEGGDNFCSECQEHFDGGACKVNVVTGECVECMVDGDHPDTFQPLKHITVPTDADLIENAIRHLTSARELLREAGTPKSLGRLRLTLTSAKGALSNARHRAHRPNRKRIRRAPAMRIETTSKTRCSHG